MFKGKKVLVTGGTGSFGHIIVKRLLKENVAEIRVFSRDEKKQYDMMQQYKDERKLKFIIGDVRDRESVRRAIRGVDIVYHAAALKQVPSSELNAYQAVLTNITGAQNVVDAALKENVEKVISISTDKAVEPVNVMGMTKAIQERIIVSANNNRFGKRTTFSCVRYGNVLGSRGSVVPLFRKQIEDNEGITITHEDMTRFIITLDQAIDLVFEATEKSVGGEIFVMKMKKHKVTDLAKIMLEAAGKEAKWKVIGIRPGEKIHETLVSPTESIRTIESDKYYIILPQIEMDTVEKKYPKYINTKIFRYSSDTAEEIPHQELKNLLKKEGWI